MTNDELLNAYLQTEIHFTDSDGRLWKTAAAASRSGVVGTVMSAIDPASSEAWVITGENPLSYAKSEHDNSIRMDALNRDLVASGLAPRTVRGFSPDGAYSEASFLILNDESSGSRGIHGIIDELAQKFEQNAYFRIRGDVQELVPGVNPVFVGSRRYVLQRVNGGVHKSQVVR
jgi:hypothetical protein